MDKKNYNENLRRENELAKLKLHAEFGMQLNETGNLNPAIENIWLNNILEFERAMAEKKQVTIHEFLDKPVLKSIHEISENELEEQLEFVMERLRIKNIVVESLDGVDDKEFYRFITEELMKEEICVNLPKNMITCFIYEEFYPNSEADIRRHTKDFMDTAMNKDSDYYTTFLASADDEVKEIRIEKMKRRLTLFRDAFDDIRLDEYEITEIDIKDTLATVIFNYKISVLPPGSERFEVISGSGKFEMTNKYEFWSIEEIDMKGVV
jgi:hypothetical protein